MADTGEWLGDALLNEPEEMQAYLARQMMARGADPYRNLYARRIMDRANEAQYLGNLFQAGEGGIANFAQNWLNARMGGGGGGAGLDRASIQQRLQGVLGNNDPNNPVWQLLNTGDPEADFKHLQAIRGIMTQGQGNMLQQAQARTLQNWFQQARGGMQEQGPTGNTNIMDWYMGRPSASPSAPGAPPSGGAPPSITPPPAPGAPPAGPDFRIDDPGWKPPVPGQPPPGRQPAPGQPPAGGAQPSAYANWSQLLDKYRADQRNWGTEGYRPNVGAFSIGGVSYDPNQDQVTNWYNMGGRDSGGVTNRGNFMGQYLYYLQLLMNQRANQGNAALGITRTTTDDQLARIAMQRMQANVRGQSTGMRAAY